MKFCNKKKYKRLIDYVGSHKRRLVAPVGGGNVEKFNLLYDISNMTSEERIAQWMFFQTKEYGHDFVFSSIPHTDICKYFGLKTYIASDNTEQVCPNQITTRSELTKLMKSKSFDDFMANPYIQAVRKFNRLSVTPVGLGGFGPTTLASYITGVEVFLKKCIQDPDFLEELINFFSEFMIQIARRGESDGADFLWVGEPVTVMISPRHFRQFSGLYVKKMFDSVSIPGFVHIPGDTNHLIGELVQTGAQCLSLDSHVDIKKIAYTVPSDVVTLGNIYSSSMLVDDVTVVEKQVIELNRKIRNFPNFIVSSGGGVINGTPDENINALFKITRNFDVWNQEEYRQINELWKLMVEADGIKVKDYLSQISISKSLISSCIDEAIEYLNFQLENTVISLSDHRKRMNSIINTRRQLLERTLPTVKGG